MSTKLLIPLLRGAGTVGIIPIGVAMAAPLINRAAVATGNENIRNVAAGVTGALTLPERLISRANAAITNVFPSFTREKAEIKKGLPMITVDKGNHLIRYYDANGKQVMAAPVGTGLISGQKHKEGDNRTPNGTFKLGKAESTKNKKGGEQAFGHHFFRTNHTNDNGVSSGIGLHGTGNPLFNGGNISHGCIRTDNSFIDKLYKLGGAPTITIYEKQGGLLKKRFI